MPLSIHPSTSTREPPTKLGARLTSSLPTSISQLISTWRLDLAPYRTFIADVTGVKLTETPAQSELKTVQSRLEGCVESYARDGDCKCHDLAQYEQIGSFTTVRELAQFFRIAVESKHSPSRRTGRCPHRSSLPRVRGQTCGVALRPARQSDPRHGRLPQRCRSQQRRAQRC